MDESAMNRVIARISYEIIERNHGVDNLCIIGILRRGGIIAQRIVNKIEEVEGKKVDIGSLDITPFRDDIEANKDFTSKTKIDFSIKDKNVVIVDDVLFTGRSTRAAIDAIMQLGRPKNIQLAVLVDRGHRELPIRPDFVGKNLPTSSDELVKVMVKEIDLVNRVSIFVG
jgi:pyrimidine operon attenuation protein / uracil phosphoribosyltransferase